MKKNLLDTTNRRKRHMTPHYTPPSARHTEEPQSPNTRDSALPLPPPIFRVPPSQVADAHTRRWRQNAMGGQKCKVHW